MYVSISDINRLISDHTNSLTYKDLRNFESFKDQYSNSLITRYKQKLLFTELQNKKKNISTIFKEPDNVSNNVQIPDNVQIPANIVNDIYYIEKNKQIHYSLKLIIGIYLNQI